MCIHQVQTMQTRINITLPEELVRVLRRSIPKRKRSKFIAETLKEKLAKRRSLERELRRSLKANYNFYKKEAEEWSVLDIEPPEWEGKL